jgi:pimeloyl-ACP methyl ester carboxylesterase
MRLLNTVHCALEYHRWALRSLPRPDGIRFARRMKQPITQPTLQIHGAIDPAVLLSSAVGSGDFVSGGYQLFVAETSGHFPHEEDPEAVSAKLLAWLETLPL